MQRIVDCRNNPEPPFVYAGRYFGGKEPMEGSPVGNPYPINSLNDRVKVLKLYRSWLFEMLNTGNRQVFDFLMAITPDTTLGCWCVTMEGGAIYTEPEVCHCQILFKAAKWLKETQPISIMQLFMEISHVSKPRRRRSPSQAGSG